MTYGEWQVGNIATNGTASNAIDLGGIYERLNIIIPTVTTGTLSAQVSDLFDGTYQALGLSVTTDSTTGAYSDTWTLGGWRFVKVVSSAAQGAERKFKVRGCNP